MAESKIRAAHSALSACWPKAADTRWRESVSIVEVMSRMGFGLVELVWLSSLEYVLFCGGDVKNTIFDEFGKEMWLVYT